MLALFTKQSGFGLTPFLSTRLAQIKWFGGVYCTMNVFSAALVTCISKLEGNRQSARGEVRWGQLNAAGRLMIVYYLHRALVLVYAFLFVHRVRAKSRFQFHDKFFFLSTFFAHRYGRTRVATAAKAATTNYDMKCIAYVHKRCNGTKLIRYLWCLAVCV